MRRVLWPLVGLSLVSCLKDGAPMASADLARVRLAVAIVGATADTLAVGIAYLDRAGNATKPVSLVDKRLAIAGGTITVPLTIDLTRCLVDPDRVVAGPACELVITVRLIERSATVDSVTLTPVDAEPGGVVTVSPAFPLVAVDTIIVRPAVDSLPVGGVVRLSDTVRASNGDVIPNARVQWTSASNSIAVVDTTGRVTAIAPGSTTVTASAGTKTGSATIVVLHGASAATLVLTPGAVAFTVQRGAAVPAADTVAVQSATSITGLALGTITYGAGQPAGWLKATLGGTTTPTTLTLVPNTTTLAAGGPYTATVPVTGIGVATQNVSVTYTVGAAPVIATAPTSVVDTALQGGTAVGTSVAITNGGGGTLSGLAASVVYGSGGTGWLSATLNTTTAPATLSLTATPGTLAVGSYGATVTLTSSVNGVAAKTIPVTLVVETGPILALAPSTRAFNVYAQGSTAPPTQTVTATNTGHGALGTISAGAPAYGAGANGWLSVTVSGSTITSRITTTKLPLGTYRATVAVSATKATNGPQTLTVTVSSTVTFTQVAAGLEASCGLTTAGTVYCWGANTFGGLGIGSVTPDSSAVPLLVQLPAGTIVSRITSGGLHACALTTTQVAYCWGYNATGQIGNGSTATSVPTPTAVAGFTFLTIAPGGAHTCGIETGDSAVVCWGDDSNGQIGNNGGGTVLTPTRLGGTVFSQIAAGGAFTCGIGRIPGSSTSLWCWGANDIGQLGAGQARIPSGASAPLLITAIPNGVSFTSLTAGVTHTCMLDNNAHAYCWGDDTQGQATGGNVTGDTVYGPAEVQAPGVHTVGLPAPQFTSISAGGRYTCGVSSAAGAVCWGDNRDGQIGNGTVGGLAGQTTVTGLTGVTSIVAGTSGFTTCALASSGTSCWGSNVAGQVGNGVAGGNIASPSLVVDQPAPAGVVP